MDLITNQIQNTTLTTENMTTTISDQLNGMKNVGISKNIAEKVLSKLNDFQNILETLSANTSNYQTYYKVYKNTVFTDAELLKQRMKDKVVRVMNDDI